MSSSLRCRCAIRSCSRLCLSALIWFGSAIKLRNCAWASGGIVRVVFAGLAAALAGLFKALSRASNAFSRASSSVFRWASCCSAVESCFWHEQTSAKGISNDRTKTFFISAVDSVCLVDEQNGRLVYVKRNLTLLRLWGKRSCRSNYNRFDVATPKSLEIGKNSQHRQTNNDNQHQHSSGSRSAGRFRFFSHRFWQIHAPISE